MKMSALTNSQENVLNLSLVPDEQRFMIGEATYQFIKRLMDNPETAEKLKAKTLEVKHRRLSEKRKGEKERANNKHAAAQELA